MTDLRDPELPDWLQLLLVGVLLLAASALVTSGPRYVLREREPDPHRATGTPECLRQWREYAAAMMVSAPDAERDRPMVACR
jgi:hypothetical protein